MFDLFENEYMHACISIPVAYVCLIHVISNNNNACSPSKVECSGIETMKNAAFLFPI